MKIWLSLGLCLVLTACQAVKPVTPVVNKTIPKVEPAQTQLVQAPKPVKAELAIADDVLTLQAWRDFRAQLLLMPVAERDLLLKSFKTSPVTTLQTLLIKLHPDSPYAVRFAAQTQLNDKLTALPRGLADLLRWDLAYNQKLLESESAVTALSRLNAQQQEQLDKLRKQSKDLQKKIDALTQIEAKLNQTGN
ncbi:MAG: hypothetical protein KJ556_05950 [Gammaproteobacteria bacterium]|nr:hypothetical protein [Gammaproteobacteria bacterium]MBU2056817.1 hypothetical protein [Gammaproteobacteria bacterium]MBU2174651.1 hypothetical protein [Gammaproteobacteria bacterium]MBU2248344.1 hypothetical protein [Gammaproteobacteria bacterium]MBU2346213.1 hypothetical protein [Gammaproteobacteria bacterium]